MSESFDPVTAILAIDQGTTGTTALLVNRAGDVIGRGYREIPTSYPQPGWVEQSADDIWQKTLGAVADALESMPVRIEAIGLTNQRETTILWDAATGRPVAPAIVWQCRRTTQMCGEL